MLKIFLVDYLHLTLIDREVKHNYFFLSFAGLNDGSASTGLSSELTVAETTQVKRPVGRPKKRPRNLENGKLMLI